MNEENKQEIEVDSSCKLMLYSFRYQKIQFWFFDKLKKNLPLQYPYMVEVLTIYLVLYNFP